MSGFLGVYRQDASFDERLLDGILLNETSLSPGRQSSRQPVVLDLHAWRRWGEACLQRIIGDFSFALHDASSKMLVVCARLCGNQAILLFAPWKSFCVQQRFLSGLWRCGHAWLCRAPPLFRVIPNWTGAARKAVRRRGWCAAHALSGTATIRECVGNSCASSPGSRRREGRSRSQPVSPSCSVWAGPLKPLPA
jgi:hypothetical protein